MGHKGSKLTQDEMRELLKCTYCKFSALMITSLSVINLCIVFDLVSVLGGCLL